MSLSPFYNVCEMFGRYLPLFYYNVYVTRLTVISLCVTIWPLSPFILCQCMKYLAVISLCFKTLYEISGNYLPLFFL